MNDTVLQIPMPQILRKEAEKSAIDMGFSSLQDFVRLVLKKLTVKELNVNIGFPIVNLSAKAEKRYLKIDKDYKANKNIIRTKNTNDFFAKLNK
jgi:hypothetical protein